MKSFLAFSIYMITILPAFGGAADRYDGFLFSPPTGWKALSPEQFQKQVAQPLAAQTLSENHWVSRPEAAFQADDSSLCVISYLDSKDGKQTTTDMLLEISNGFEQQLRRTGTIDKVGLTSNGLRLQQLRVVGATMVVFKTLFQTATGRIAQIDLYVPRDQYEAQRLLLEASMKTLALDR